MSRTIQLNTDVELLDKLRRLIGEQKGLRDDLRHYFSWRTTKDLDIAYLRLSQLESSIAEVKAELWGRVLKSA